MVFAKGNTSRFRTKYFIWATLVYIAFGMSILTLLSSCTSKETDAAQPLARVEQKMLYKDEINNLVPQGVSGADSIMMLKRYIDLWIKKQLILTEAEKKSAEYMEEIDKKAAAYRESLIMYEFQKQLIQQRLDTAVSDSAILVFYKQHAKDFELKQNIVKGYYAVVRPKSTGFEKINREFQRQAVSPAYASQLELVLNQYADEYRIELDNWVSFDQLVRATPFTKINNKTDWLIKNKKAKVEEKGRVYMLFISDYKLESGISPLDYVKEQIKSIILNTRKTEILESFEDYIYKRALSEKRVEVYAD